MSLRTDKSSNHPPKCEENSLWLRITYRDGRIDQGVVRNDLLYLQKMLWSERFEYHRLGSDRGPRELISTGMRDLATVQVLGVVNVPK